MSVILVEGGRKLSGAVTVQGAKNSVLPMLAATVLCPGVCCLRGCPALSDVDTAVQIIRHLGGTVHREGPDLVVDTRQITGCEIFLAHQQIISSVFLFSIYYDNKIMVTTSPP